MKKYYLTTLRLWRLLEKFQKHFYLQLLLEIILQLANVYTIYLTSTILNDIVQQDYASAYRTTLIVIFFTITRYGLMYLKGKHTLKYIQNEINNYLQEYSLKKVFNLNAFQYIEDHSAIKLQSISRGEVAAKSIIETIFLNLLPTFTQVIFSIAAIYIFSPLIAIVTLIVFIVGSVWSNLFASYHRKFIKQNIENWDNNNKIRAETFQHLNLIKNTGSERRYLEEYMNGKVDIIKYDLLTWGKSHLNNHLRFSFFAVSRGIITLLLVHLAFLQKVTVGNIYAIWSWANEAFNGISNVIHASRELPLRFVELDKYLDIIDRKPEFNEGGIKKFSTGDIQFQNVSFIYPKGNDHALKNINLLIESGKKTAFVGFSGSGKSTVIKLLLRIYDWSSGEIFINGVSLRKLDSRLLRHKIGYVEQNVDLFDTSIKKNILFGLEKQNIDEHELGNVIHESRIDQFFHRLGEKGLDTIIGERGVRLSGGEKQRIGIARALIKNPEILIFDEATASLDTENEKYIQEAIDESSRGRTTIVIAHRLSTVLNADKIIVMDKGIIVGEGNHNYLKETCVEYQRLIEAQHG